MKRDTRRAILDMAKTLFSQQGYNAVSIGEIAGALGISKGNVTYHFKRKEDIMEALLAEAEQIEVIPTLVLYRDGKAVDSIVNPGSKAAIDQFIQEAMAK